MYGRHQHGMTTVEFSIVGLLVLTLLFASVEFGRAIFTFNVLQEGARRAARVAAVCPVGDAKIAQAAILIRLPGLTAENVTTEYLDSSGIPLANAADSGYGQIRYVRVRLVGYSLPILIPLAPRTFDVPEFSSTLPRESLGVPRFGAAAAC